MAKRLKKLLLRPPLLKLLLRLLTLLLLRPPTLLLLLRPPTLLLLLQKKRSNLDYFDSQKAGLVPAFLFSTHPICLQPNPSS